MKSNAPDILKKGLAAMEERAKLRDKPDGERSMAKTVELFNVYTGKNLSESEGWAFMVFLKMVRAQGGSFHEDDYVDGASFMALLGECVSCEPVKAEYEPVAFPGNPQYGPIPKAFIPPKLGPLDIPLHFGTASATGEGKSLVNNHNDQCEYE